MTEFPKYMIHYNDLDD